MEAVDSEPRNGRYPSLGSSVCRPGGGFAVLGCFIHVVPSHVFSPCSSTESLLSIFLCPTVRMNARDEKEEGERGGLVVGGRERYRRTGSQRTEETTQSTQNMFN